MEAYFHIKKSINDDKQEKFSGISTKATKINPKIFYLFKYKQYSTLN